jgi:hypothetical protein
VYSYSSISGRAFELKESEKLFCTEKLLLVSTGLVIAEMLTSDKRIRVQNNFICIYILGVSKKMGNAFALQHGLQENFYHSISSQNG